MKRIVSYLASSVVVAMVAGPLRAQTPPADAAPVVAAVQRLFDGMAQRDTAAARALLLPGTRFVALLSDTAPALPRTQSDAAFLRMLATRPERPFERMWAPVIDTFTLLRTAAGWQIAALAYTVQRRGCAPSPLGAPRSGAASPTR